MADTVRTYLDLLRPYCKETPRAAVILGSGLGALGDRLEDASAVDYASLPGFPVSTAPGHRGRFLFGRLAGVPVVCMQGRLHLYEGHSARDVALPVRVMRGLGAEILLATNAAGGINTGFSVGDLMLIEDHINFTGQNPLVGPNDGSLGPRFPDMSYAYDPALRALAERCAAACGIRLCKGVYLACQGPSYETPAEIRAFRTLGADAVGMSTVPEVIAANHCGMRVLAFSLISNMAAGVLPQKLTEEEVLEAGRQNGARLERLVTAILQNL